MTHPSVTVGLNTVWVVLTASMIFFMEGGFALLEAGFVRQKNQVSIIMKVLADLIFGALVYYLVGFGLMFGRDWLGSVGISGFALTGSLAHLPSTIPHPAFWLFQAAFAVAAVSIVSGSVAERMNFKAYILYIVAMAAVIYPISGHWVWGHNGWLGRLGMQDFAGSTVIHAMAGFACIAAATLVGPRIGKYDKNGKPLSFSPSNLPLAAVGTFVLWFGWFGFNAGSTLNAQDGAISSIAMNTLLASVAGGGSALLYSLFKTDKADLGATVNGVLAGLVAITAGCAYVAPWAAILIGAAAGALMIWATGWVENLRIDDPVGAIAVHGVNGVFGTLMVGVFASRGGVLFGGGWHLLGVQALGTVTVSVWGFGATWGALKLISWFVPLRVSAEDEERGLDISIHGTDIPHLEPGFLLSDDQLWERRRLMRLIAGMSAPPTDVKE
ncbi:ammonium transporter [Alicyclobacillus cycloheptanicus]|uniref:Ammonium transporter n=1 Tax=Alicyclobacillus cycloheptanicus TaxID=1457 RepID=A0ABT9XIT2_9BACL|nr:ammonium transporter [Alicyclobacillus cycloheptanicus]MDQ0190222.1 Amt family ammonium transporter [Alicyclobacillus cycloheptanicus]